MSTPPKIRYISECFIKPQYALEESKRPFYLSPWDLTMLSAHYIQKGLLYNKPPSANAQADFIKSLLDKLKQSLSVALVHFYPLSGRLVTQINENPPSSLVFVDCSNSPGTKFIYAALDMTISDILLRLMYHQSFNPFLITTGRSTMMVIRGLCLQFK